ncbi:hypothetical protein DYB32_006793 [Aphanomyces invadans]|uniref:Elongator complex protein 5 n=1 Tax=Aphanomyces invadans TaxID=157072 RepID=A0A3R6VIY8_9STRA|nr:hypothetical protein DYB32_006793 [Aphanomyces invadans]
MSPTRVDLLDGISAVDAHFRLKCIPAALGEAVSNHGKAKTTSNFVLVEDRQGCAGAGRVMLQHIVDQLALSARTKHFVHVHLETDNGAPVDGTTSSHHHIHYAGDIGGWFAVDKTASLLERIRRDVEAQNGQTTDVTEYFEFFPRDDEMPSGTTRSLVMHTQQVAEQRAKAATQTQATDTPLGTLLSDLTFNLNVTRRDDDSRRQVVLPYQHQGNPPPHRGDMPLFYIDQDDPDWDDDDLDDDLDI